VRRRIEHSRLVRRQGQRNLYNLPRRIVMEDAAAKNARTKIHWKLNPIEIDHRCQRQIGSVRQSKFKFGV
jgi:hypothetical protein